MQFRSDTQCKVDIKQFEKIGKPISRGAYGIIYKVKDKKTNKFYAAKIITSEINKESLDREIGILMYSNHPTIIKFIGFSLEDLHDDDNPTIIMELAERGSLLDILNQIRSGEKIHNYTNTNRQIILIGISRGMKYLHDRNIIHRDLKPGNVLLNNEFQPLITDFGMSKFFKVDESKNQSQHGGTLIYMAPEIIEESDYGRKVDVYAFGILMFEVVTESIPYPDLDKGDITPYKFMDKVTDKKYRPKIDETIKESFKELIEQCWSENPDERPTFSEIFKKLTNKDNEFGTKYFFDNVDNDKIKSYIENITQIDDPIEELNQQMKMIQKEVKQLKNNDDEILNENQQLKNKIVNVNEYEYEETVSIKDNKAVNHKLLSPQDDDDDDDDLVEETVKFKAPNSIHYKLLLTSLTAEVVESQEVKGDVFIPTFVDDQSKQFKVIKICDEAFKNSSIDTLSFSEESQVESIGNFAFKNSTIHKLYIPASLTKLNQNFAEEANNLTEIEVDKNNRYFQNESGFLIYTPNVDVNTDINKRNNTNENNSEGIKQNENTNDNNNENVKNIEDINQYESITEENDDKSQVILFAPRNFEGDFIIPKKVASIGLYAFSQRSGILSVKSESPFLKKIRSHCFFKCDNLKTVSFKGQTELFLGGFCFSQSKHLSIVEISCKTIGIGKSCFEDCSSLNSVNFNESEEVKVSQHAFKGCTSLKRILIHKASLIKIGSKCFDGATNLQSAAFVGSSVTLGNYFIANCQSLSLITIESENDLAISSDTFGINNLKYVKLSTKSALNLDDFCFRFSNKLENIELSFKEINFRENCFSECSFLTVMSIHCENEIKILNEIFSGCKTLKKLILSSESNIFICDQFMSGSNKLESIEISGLFVSIGSNSFNNCQSLSRFSITKAAQTEFKENQFINCNKLETISIQSSIVNICQNQICNSKSLKRIEIESTSQIFFRANCFSGFVSLENVTISGENILIEDSCFKDCSNLNKIELIKARNLTFGSSVFSKCSKLNEVDFKVDSNLICGNDCFYGSNVRKATFEIKFVELGKSCFENHFYAKSTIAIVSIKGEKVKIGELCFCGCSYLKEFSILSSEDIEIGVDSFKGCNSLEVLNLSVDGKLKMLNNCFSSSKSLKELSVLSSENLEIGNYAFEDCTSLEKVSLKAENNIILLANCFSKDEKLKTFDFKCNDIFFGEYCFYNCTSLLEFINKTSNKIIFSFQTFNYCNNLEKVEITTKSEFEAGNYCFDRLPKLEKAIVDSPIVKVGDFCFNICTSLTVLSFPSTMQISYYDTFCFECQNTKFYLNPNAKKIKNQSENIGIQKGYFYFRA